MKYDATLLRPIPGQSPRPLYRRDAEAALLADVHSSRRRLMIWSPAFLAEFTFSSAAGAIIQKARQQRVFDRDPPVPFAIEAFGWNFVRL